MNSNLSTDQSLLKTDLSKRIYGLDILRAIAILTVLIGHTSEYIPTQFSPILRLFIFDGVSIFFVLSGFLIGNILIKSFSEKSITSHSVLSFWVNRWLRTLPPYFFTLILILAVTYIFSLEISPFSLGKKKVLSYFVFLQNFSWAHFGFFAESWSLAVEEWFYLLTPLVLIICNKIFRLKLKSSFIITICFIVLFPTIFRYYRYLHIDSISLVGQNILDSCFRKQVITRLDCIMIGVFGAYISTFYSIFWKKIKYTAFLIGVILTVVMIYYNNQFFPMYQHVFHFGLEATIVLCTLPLMHSITSGKGSVYKILTFISLTSYSLYLLHYTFIKYCIVENVALSLNLSQIASLILFWVLTISLSTLMYLYIEKPFMNLRKKLKYLQ